MSLTLCPKATTRATLRSLGKVSCKSSGSCGRNTFFTNKPAKLPLLCRPHYTSGMDLHIGTSGWSYPTWKPAFFPEGLPAKRYLEFYSTRLNAVELNATFRRMPTANSIAGWVPATTPDFRFAAKAHQSITHFKRLKNSAHPLPFLLQSLEPMRQSGKLGPVLVQVPPHLNADLVLLKDL